MSGNDASQPAAADDITRCDREAIHIPGSIQPHGMLAVLQEPELVIVQASANLAVWAEGGAVLGRGLDSVFRGQAEEMIRLIRQSPIRNNPLYLQTVTLESQDGEKAFHVLAHRHDRSLILEFEQAFADPAFYTLYPLVHSFIASLEQAGDIPSLSRAAAREVRELTGFDRVLIYKFDADWNGEVIAEERDESCFPSLLGHHFPASDIPRQARELYRANRLRLIPDAGYIPVPLQPAINPLTQKPLDMSFATLRSVSPVHLEYMRNMETLSSMSVSILVQGTLWGLISCHNRLPKAIPFDIRNACDFIGQMLSLHIAAKEYNAGYERRIALKAVNSHLLERMTASDSYQDVLIQNEKDVLALTGSAGAALVAQGECVLLGHTPDKKQVMALAGWLTERMHQDMFHTISLSALFGEARDYKDTASGLLAISISRLHTSLVLWFRPEVLQTIRWAGDPAKPVEADGGRMHPRKSFETWRETVHLKSLPWQHAEIEAASELRNAVVGIVLKRAEELAGLTQELERSNKELEAFSYSVSHDLRAPFRHIVGYAELVKEMEAERLSERCRGYLDNVIDSGKFAGQLVDNLLHFSQVGRLPMEPVAIDMNRLVEETRREVLSEAEGRAVSWDIASMPVVMGDVLLMRLAVRNLLSNALKYSRTREETRIKIGYGGTEEEHVFYVQDNGIGFEMEYSDKLFGVFQRLHKMEDFEGTGIGLANVKRIITRQGGRVWAEGKPDQGAIFYFALPRKEKEQTC